MTPQTFLATIPLGRGSTPRDVANTCAFLCSDEADFLTGIDIPVDGGRVSMIESGGRMFRCANSSGSVFKRPSR